VLRLLVQKELLSPEWAARILSWRHSGFSVHIHKFIVRAVSHIPDKGQVMVRTYGLYANACRGKVRKPDRVPVALGMIDEERLVPLHFRFLTLVRGREYHYPVMGEANPEPAAGGATSRRKRNSL
jgi:hypothetical protein